MNSQSLNSHPIHRSRFFYPYIYPQGRKNVPVIFHPSMTRFVPEGPFCTIIPDMVKSLLHERFVGDTCWCFTMDKL